jgi:hypothetical protein
MCDVNSFQRLRLSLDTRCRQRPFVPYSTVAIHTIYDRVPTEYCMSHAVVCGGVEAISTPWNTVTRDCIGISPVLSHYIT